MSVPKDYPISQLRKVTFWFRKEGTMCRMDHPHVHYLHCSQVATFLAATLELHYHPGINPHNGAKTSTLWEVVVEEFLGNTKALWWTTPGLGKDRAQVGAEVMCNTDRDRVWFHPELLAHEKELNEQEWQEEMRA